MKDVRQRGVLQPGAAVRESGQDQPLAAGGGLAARPARPARPSGPPVRPVVQGGWYPEREPDRGDSANVGRQLGCLGGDNANVGRHHSRVHRAPERRFRPGEPSIDRRLRLLGADGEPPGIYLDLHLLPEIETRLIDHGWLIDLPFLLIFTFEFNIRWLLAVRRRTYPRWFIFPIFHWYDLLGIVPLPQFRVFRRGGQDTGS